MLRTRVTAAVRRSATPATSRLRTASLSIAQRPYSSGSQINDNDPEVIESEKLKNLRNEQHGTSTPHKYAPGWNEYLASTSEAYTKVEADKSDIPLSEMQSYTVEHVGKRHPKTVTETVMNKVSEMADTVKDAAQDVKETMMGPLASAVGKKTVDDSTEDNAPENKGKK